MGEIPSQKHPQSRNFTFYPRTSSRNNIPQLLPPLNLFGIPSNTLDYDDLNIVHVDQATFVSHVEEFQRDDTIDICDDGEGGLEGVGGGFEEGGLEDRDVRVICGMTGFIRGQSILELQTTESEDVVWGRGTEEIDISLFMFDLCDNALKIIFRYDICNNGDNLQFQVLSYQQPLCREDTVWCI